MKTLIVIPARGGSKAIPKKNIYPLNHKPLLHYTLEVITQADLKDCDVAVSTDSEEIAKCAIEFCANFQNLHIINRPDEISHDHASTESALIHALEVMQEKMSVKYSAVMTLQPTSPFRKAQTLRAFYDEFLRSNDRFDALLSLHETRSDFWTNDDSSFARLFKDAPRRRQDRKPLYVENSAYYITLADSLLETNCVLGERPNGFVISESEGLDINEPMDLLVAEGIIKARNLKKE